MKVSEILEEQLKLQVLEEVRLRNPVWALTTG